MGILSNLWVNIHGHKRQKVTQIKKPCNYLICKALCAGWDSNSAWQSIS